jgi:transposase
MTITNIKEKTKTRESVSFKGQIIHVGLDVHKKNWSSSIYLGDKFIKTFHQELTGTILLQHLKTNYPDAVYKAFYEAGFCVFSVQRDLTTLGIECVVVNASDIPQTNKGMLRRLNA